MLDIRGWMSIPQCLLFHLLRLELRKRGDNFNWVKYVFLWKHLMLLCLLYFFRERNKIKNVISILPRIFVSKSFAYTSFIHFTLFLPHRHKSDLYLEELLVIKLPFEFVSFYSRSSFNMDLLLCCYAFDFCNPDKDPRFCSFLITATAFHIIFVRLTCKKGSRDAIA